MTLYYEVMIWIKELKLNIARLSNNNFYILQVEEELAEWELKFLNHINKDK